MELCIASLRRWFWFGEEPGSAGMSFMVSSSKICAPSVFSSCSVFYLTHRNTSSEYTHPQHTGSPLHFHHPNAEGEVVSASDRGHATSSGFLSHSVALVCLVGSGLFASVLAPPAATGVIRDFAVKATGNKQVYKGPAARLIEQLVGKTTNSPNNAMIPKTPQLVQTQRNFSRTSTLNRTLVPQHTPSNRDKSTSRPMSYTILSRSKPKP